MLRRFACTTLIALSCARATQALELPPYSTKFSLGYHYSAGSYGGSGTTEITYVPLVVRGDIGNWSASITVPYLRISGDSVTIDGVTTGNADGLGDVLARTAYTLVPWTDWMPFIDFIGRIKFPTASRSEGLGTGELDYGLEVELAKTIDRFTPFVLGGYRVLGSPPDSELRNVGLASAGGTYSLLDNLNLGLFADYREAASAASHMRLELVPFASWKITAHWSVDIYATAGLAKGSPDGGTGVQLGWSP